jgi:hypothetical protein
MSYLVVLLASLACHGPPNRNQAGLAIPAGVERVTVRAHDLSTGWGGREVTVDLAVAQGPDFVVERHP